MAAIQCTNCGAVGESSLATIYCASCYEGVEAMLETALALLMERDLISFCHDMAMLRGDEQQVAKLKPLLQAAAAM